MDSPPGCRHGALPDFSVIGDPLERRGTITVRLHVEDETEMLLMLQRRHAVSVPVACVIRARLFVRNSGRHRAGETDTGCSRTGGRTEKEDRFTWANPRRR
ncbi:hypothetical protein GCM10010104_25800 [Streptomyces indiaensis]|uniref:Uncharacterized protein n=1 Tax=Streptomyces indiaensis TaxID=284033 RepID=A0ABN3DGV0_9ACTN